MGETVWGHSAVCAMAIPFTAWKHMHLNVEKGECLPGARPARYFSINYPDFSPRFTLSWRKPPK